MLDGLMVMAVVAGLQKKTLTQACVWNVNPTLATGSWLQSREEA